MYKVASATGGGKSTSLPLFIWATSREYNINPSHGFAAGGLTDLIIETSSYLAA